MRQSVVWGLCLLLTVSVAEAQPPKNLQRDQLVAWCIVPFDSQQRTPEQRAEMLVRLGLKRVAYDWRPQHVAEFETEIEQYRQHGLEYFAFWGEHERAFELFEKHCLHPQVWKMLPAPAGETDAEKTAQSVEQLLSLVDRTRQLKCQLGLYNHGGWQGEPDNLVAICRALRKHHNAEHVGIVYNLHHGHGHLNDFAESLEKMQPYLLCFNLNGMNLGGDAQGDKILPLGAGSEDLRLLQTIVESGYTGPIGVIGHTQDDVEQRLQDNLDGLDWLLPQLADHPAGPKPKYRTWAK
ncbi:MAG: sugar phosphate isomerase/epimerase family protein [Planctomycetaceae bacterium]